MPDHAKQVGILCQRVIDLLGLSMTEGQSILLGESNIAHMVSRHPADFALYGEYIPLILAAPDYVALLKYSPLHGLMQAHRERHTPTRRKRGALLEQYNPLSEHGDR